MKRIFTIGITIALLAGCREKKAVPVEQQFCLDKELKSKISIEEAKAEPVATGVHLMGSVEANADKQVTYSSLTNGVVNNVFFSLGDKVQKGQVLAEVKSVELNSLQSESGNILQQIRIAERKLETLKDLYADGMSSGRELQEAQSELEILKSEQRRTGANMSLYNASTSKGVFQVKAPSSGVITSKNIAPGTQLNSESESLFTVSNLDEVWVMANIYTSNIAEIKEGMPVEITTLSYPGQTFRGKVSVLSQVMDNDSKVLQARIVMPNKDLLLKPGMMVDITALKNETTMQVCLPEASLVFDNNEYYVLIYKEDCSIEVRKIKTGSRNHNKIYIPEGIVPGEKIITRNHLLIYQALQSF
ncbi:efflux RND transporter periplasmic adaptor subunit [Niabella yanshanensis]|uniref:Efflux RND transporter periplasmic adaptor subunit n=1 Tax=Niabella yanshanensis TaxID=577386 RepID=A0ABZ0W8I4_9BACT|nr:efflux RND transporter periplasmic adaptor subunit [Niabella yanshanensis]WQD39590.1 efflux RND transporter periplasmic adaptor subunit [Niabella yanshanensis]